GSNALTSPLDTIAFALQLLSSPTFYPHLIETAQAFAVALGIAISCGILIGFTLGLYRFAADVGEPVLVALYSIPQLTLYPIGLHNVRMIMALTLLLVIIAVTASAVLFAVDRRLQRHTL